VENSLVDESKTKDSVQSVSVDNISENESLLSNDSSSYKSSDNNNPCANMDWYVLHVYSGFELKVKQFIHERVRQHGLVGQVGEIFVPQQTEYELVKGEKKKTRKKFFPGYILVQMIMNEDTWHLVRDTPKVAGFLGDATNPHPLPPEEVSRIVNQSGDDIVGVASRVSFSQGDTITVTEGPFAEFTGTVEEVRPEKGKVKVLISIFGRNTPVELDFAQIQKS
jgi:transcription termination/antitermination protein NusG